MSATATVPESGRKVLQGEGAMRSLLDAIDVPAAATALTALTREVLVHHLPLYLLPPLIGGTARGKSLTSAPVRNGGWRNARVPRLLRLRKWSRVGTLLPRG